MVKTVEFAPDDTEMMDALEFNFAQFLMAYSAVSGINYWSLMLMAFDITHGAFQHVDRAATANLLDATTKMVRTKSNSPDLIDRRRKAMTRLLERGHFLSQETKGTA